MEYKSAIELTITVIKFSANHIVANISLFAQTKYLGGMTNTVHYANITHSLNKYA